MKLHQENYQITKKNETQALPAFQMHLKKKTSGTLIQQNSKYQFVETVQAADNQQFKSSRQPDQNNLCQSNCKLEGSQMTDQNKIGENLNVQQNIKQIQLENLCQQIAENQIFNDRITLNQNKLIDTPVTSDNQKYLINKKYNGSTIQRQSQNNQSIDGLNQKIDDNFKDSYIKSNFAKDNHEQYDQLFNRDIKKMDLSFSDSVLYYLFPCPKLIKRKKNKIDFCNQIISEQLDGVYILKKLLEPEKLKAILLSEEQLKLFEYIPSPTMINQYQITPHSNCKRVKNNVQILMTQQMLMVQKIQQKIYLHLKRSQITSVLKQNLTRAHLKFQENSLKQKNKNQKKLFRHQNKQFRKKILQTKTFKILQMIDPKFRQINNLPKNSDFEVKKCDFSHIAITNQRLNNQNELISITEIKNNTDGIANSELSNNIANQINDFKFNKLN
ncbi:hypothetical protein ABPG72_013507 [Tetrahymena utriculariae]